VGRRDSRNELKLGAKLANPWAQIEFRLAPNNNSVTAPTVCVYVCVEKNNVAVRVPDTSMLTV